MPVKYLSIVPVHPPFDIGEDSYLRSAFSCNYRGRVIGPFNVESDVRSIIVNEISNTDSRLPFFEDVGVYTGRARTLSEGAEILIIATGGFESQIPHNNQHKISTVTFQVLSFDLNHDYSYLRAMQIYHFMQGLFNIVIE